MYPYTHLQCITFIRKRTGNKKIICFYRVNIGNFMGMQLKLSYVDPHNKKVVECVYNAEKHEDISTAYLHAVKIISDKMGKYVHVKLLDDDCGCTSCG